MTRLGLLIGLGVFLLFPGCDLILELRLVMLLLLFHCGCNVFGVFLTSAFLEAS
jgi:hypothetical protein